MVNIHTNRNEGICPACGSINTENEFDTDNGDEQTDLVECIDCGFTFKAFYNIETIYTFIENEYDIDTIQVQVEPIETNTRW